MTAPLSRDLRERIVRAVKGGASIRGAAMRFEVSPSAAVKLMRRVRETGSAAPGRIGGHRRPVLAPHEGLLRSLVDAKDDITLAEIKAELGSRGIIVQALSTIHLALRCPPSSDPPPRPMWAARQRRVSLSRCPLLDLTGQEVAAPTSAVHDVERQCGDALIAFTVATMKPQAGHQLSTHRSIRF
jgi:putative transposase